MGHNKNFDFTHFMPETLQIPSLATAPTRKAHSNQFRYYEDFVRQDPFKVLNHGNFSVKPTVPKHVTGSDIQEFFRSSKVFITGGTGFLGKVLIEKLIRSVPHLKQLYILIRPKKGKTAEERLSELMKDEVSSFRFKINYRTQRLVSYKGFNGILIINNKHNL